jgi:FemAB-related protein (PEP-CTERM system-associated)
VSDAIEVPVPTEGIAAGPLRVRETVPADEAAWDALVRSHPRGSPFHLPAWQQAVKEVFGHRPCHLVAERSGRLEGVLPLFLVRSPFRATHLLSIPYGVYGGPLGESPEAEDALLRSACDLARSMRVAYLELRYLEPPRGEGAEVLVPLDDFYETFLRDLPPPGSDSLALLPRKARAAARHARDRFGLEFVEGRWYLPDLYRLFAINKRRLGSPGLPWVYFARLHDLFRREMVVHLVRNHGRPLAAVLSFLFGSTVMPYYSGTLPEAEEVHASNFMYWKLLDWAIERGFRRFDFGRSRRGSGAFAFKENQGFEPVPLPYRFFLVRRRRLPTFTPSNPRLDLPRRIWRAVPLPVTIWLSRPLNRYLP